MLSTAWHFIADAYIR